MAKLNPLPKNSQVPDFAESLLRSVRQIFFAIGGGGENAGVPTIFAVEDTPTTDPGWTTSSSVDMNAPDTYVKINIDGTDYVIPAWTT